MSWGNKVKKKVVPSKESVITEWKNNLSGYDEGALKGFVRSAYSINVALKKNVLIPHSGVGKCMAVPCSGLTIAEAVPSDGAISPHLSYLSIPHHGHHLDIPSPTELTN